MTKEQWMLYFYGIYPTGGTFFVLTIVLVLIAFLYIAVYDVYHKDRPYILLGKGLQIAAIIYIPVLVLHFILPPKNIAVAIIAAPYGVSMLENNASKINKLDEILDLSLDKVIMKLKDK